MRGPRLAPPVWQAGLLSTGQRCGGMVHCGGPGKAHGQQLSSGSFLYAAGTCAVKL